MSGFKLQSAVLGERNFEFLPDNLFGSNDPRNLFTILIGENGSGKSFCLTKLTESMRYANANMTGRKRLTTYTIRGSKNGVDFLLRNETLKDRGILPSRVIAVSHSIFDKFSPAQMNDHGFYDYIGSKDSGIDNEKYCAYDLLDTIHEHIDDRIFQYKIGDLLKYLGLDKKLIIGLEPRYTHQSELYHKLFSKKLTRKQIIESFQLRLSKLSSSQRNKVKLLFQDDEFMHGFVEFLARSKGSIYDSDKNKKGIYYHIDLNRGSDSEKIKDDLKYLTLLRKTNVLSYSFVNINKKKGLSYDIQDSSSGEVSLLTSLGRMIPHIKDFSLIIIDEPETSLHPNWQLDYLKLLRNVLKGCIGCHVIIATHSPFIVAEADPTMCAVVKTKPHGESEFVDSSFGWSIDEILSKVFNLKSVRSYEFERLLRELFSKMASPAQNKTRIKKLIDEINQYPIPEFDPVLRMLEHAKKKISNAS